MAFRKRNSSFGQRNNRKESARSTEKNALANVVKALDNPLEEASFENLPQTIVDAYKRAGWDSVMPVQAKSIPYLLADREIMLQSRTGSGKTAAYLLPLIERMDLGLKRAQGLVLVPTRELALQVEKEANKLFGHEVSSVSLYGGVPYQKQLDALRRGAQVIIGTPGRVLDHLQKGSLKLNDLNMLILDEADRMLSIGFYPDMKAVQEYLPENILTTLFSATYPMNVLKLADEFLKKPEFLSLSDGQVHIAEMQHYSVFCKRMEKDRTLIRLLEVENPSSSIIFCNTKATVHYITQVLQGFGYNAEELSSEVSQSRREYVLNRLRRGETRFLVATDVAARGIDIPMLSHVFLYEPPEDRESYIHRAGRTARAGAMGAVFSLVDTMERLELEKIASFYEIDLLNYDKPSDDDVENAVSTRLIALLEQQKRNLNGLQKERVARYLNIAAKLANPDIDADGEQDKDSIFLFAMLLDDLYQKSLNPSFADTRNPRGRSNNRRDKNEKPQEAPLTGDDTLDSMRDTFQASFRGRGQQGRGQRNSNNRNFPPREAKEKRSGYQVVGDDNADRNFEDKFDRKRDSFNRDENRSFGRKKFENRDNRDDSFSRSKMFGRKRADYSDDDVFDDNRFGKSNSHESKQLFPRKPSMSREFSNFAEESDMQQARRNAFGRDFDDDSFFNNSRPAPRFGKGRNDRFEGRGDRQGRGSRQDRNDRGERSDRDPRANREQRRDSGFAPSNRNERGERSFEHSNDRAGDRTNARNARFSRNAGRNDDRASSAPFIDKNSQRFSQDDSFSARKRGASSRFSDDNFFSLPNEERSNNKRMDKPKGSFRGKPSKKR